MACLFPATEQIYNGTNRCAGEEEKRGKEQDKFQFKTGVALDPTTHSCPDTLDGKEFPARKDQAENPCNGPPYQEENADVWRERDNRTQANTCQKKRRQPTRQPFIALTLSEYLGLFSIVTIRKETYLVSRGFAN